MSAAALSSSSSSSKSSSRRRPASTSTGGGGGSVPSITLLEFTNLLYRTLLDSQTLIQQRQQLDNNDLAYRILHHIDWFATIHNAKRLKMEVNASISKLYPPTYATTLFEMKNYQDTSLAASATTAPQHSSLPSEITLQVLHALYCQLVHLKVTCQFSYSMLLNFLSYYDGVRLSDAFIVDSGTGNEENTNTNTPSLASVTKRKRNSGNASFSSTSTAVAHNGGGSAAVLYTRGAILTAFYNAPHAFTLNLKQCEEADYQAIRKIACQGFKLPVATVPTLHAMLAFKTISTFRFVENTSTIRPTSEVATFSMQGKQRVLTYVTKYIVYVYDEIRNCIDLLENVPVAKDALAELLCVTGFRARFCEEDAYVMEWLLGGGGGTGTGTGNNKAYLLDAYPQCIDSVVGYASRMYLMENKCPNIPRVMPLTQPALQLVTDYIQKYELENKEYEYVCPPLVVAVVGKNEKTGELLVAYKCTTDDDSVLEICDRISGSGSCMLGNLLFVGACVKAADNDVRTDERGYFETQIIVASSSSPPSVREATLKGNLREYEKIFQSAVQIVLRRNGCSIAGLADDIDSVSTIATRQQLKLAAELHDEQCNKNDVRNTYRMEHDALRAVIDTDPKLALTLIRESPQYYYYTQQLSITTNECASFMK